MPPYQEVHSWMEISSLTSWQDIAKWFWELQQPQAYPNDAIRATVKTVTANAKTDEEKARAIYDWVANKTRYVGLEFGISAFRPHPAADVHDKLYGDCKDKATLLITMLGVAGVKASPVLLNVEDRTAVSDRLPGPQAFDHCIAVADVAGKEVWLDATAETCAYGDIPESDRGVQALVIRNGKGEFETIPRYAATENGVEIATNIQARPDGGATVKSEMKWRGGASQQWREGIRSITPDKRKLTMQRMAQSFSVGATVKDFTLPDGADKNGPFVMGLSADAPNWARRTSRLLLLPISNWLNGNERRNPFVQDKRVWPIVSNDSSQTTNTVTISLPEGYILDDTPENVSLSGPFQEYRRVITLAPDGKSVVIKETTVEKAGKVPQGEYAKVRAYYDSLLKSADDFIVLKKAK